jgi:HEAT repeat protein
MHEQILQALLSTTNEAADDLLLEGLRLGVDIEQAVMLDALLSRKTVHGLSGVIELYDELSPRLQQTVLRHIKVLHHALRECGRSNRPELRLGSMKLISLSRQGKLAYVLSENLHEQNELLSKAAVEAMVGLARWIATGMQQLQSTPVPLQQNEEEMEGAMSVAETAAIAAAAGGATQGSDPQPLPAAPVDLKALYKEILEQRPEIEVAVARALDVHRGRHTQELLRAALLLADWPQSKTLAVLSTPKHGGQSPMVRRLQQPPTPEYVDAFLLGATFGQLRLHFGTAFSNIKEAPVLDAMLRRTHWLKDHQLQLCLHQVTRGVWWQEVELMHDIERRGPEEAARIGEWLAASGTHDLMQDERLARLADHAKDSFPAKLRLMRIAMRRKRGASVHFLKKMLSDTDERLIRLAAREIVRRRPADMDNMLLQLMTNAPVSVRRVISRSIGQAGFEHYWARFDRLDKSTRKHAGRAMLKLLPDAHQRLARRLASGPIEQRLKAMQMTQELGLSELLREQLSTLSNHPHPKVRSKAVSVLGEMNNISIEVLLDRVLNDVDSRVRANAIEILETRPAAQFIPLLAARAKSGQNNRERANAIKALHRMKVGNVGPQLIAMLHDDRPEHRISALWALKQMGWWKLLQEVGQLAKEDTNMRVRRYAVGVIKGVAELVQGENKEKAG